MKVTNRSVRSNLAAVAVLAALLAVVQPATAQIPNSSAAALGMAGNYTAIASGFNAVAWNPATLALDPDPGTSVAIIPIRGSTGTGPVSLSDLSAVEGEFLSDETKAGWLDRIRSVGHQRVASSADVTYIALQTGRLAFQVSTRGGATFNVPDGAAELLLFGNAGRTGEPEDFSFADWKVDATATSSVGLSYALPVPLGRRTDGGSPLAVGATVNYTVGHGLVTSRDAGSTIEGDPLRVSMDFPLIRNDPAHSLFAGGGVGLDLGATWRADDLTIAFAARNVAQTFQWDESKLSYRPGRVTFEGGTSTTNVEERPFAEAPDDMKEHVRSLTFEPTVGLGIAQRVGSGLRVAVDLRHRLADGLSLEPRTHVGAGIEFRPLGFLPLRAGAAVVTGGYQVAAGFGLEGDCVRLTAGGAQRMANGSVDTTGMLVFSIGAR